MLVYMTKIIKVHFFVSEVGQQFIDMRLRIKKEGHNLVHNTNSGTLVTV